MVQSHKIVSDTVDHAKLSIRTKVFLYFYEFGKCACPIFQILMQNLLLLSLFSSTVPLYNQIISFALALYM